jgi:hypothetical protein
LLLLRCQHAKILDKLLKINSFHGRLPPEPLSTTYINNLAEQSHFESIRVINSFIGSSLFFGARFDRDVAMVFQTSIAVAGTKLGASGRNFETNP